jgi:MFS family permease
MYPIPNTQLSNTQSLSSPPYPESLVMAELTLDRATEKNVRWNFTVNLLDVSIFVLAASLVSRDTVLPALVSNLTDSKIAIGLIPAMWSLGFYLPQLLMANFTERLRYKKPFVVAVSGIGERTPFLLIGLAIWFLAIDRPTVALYILLAGIGVAAASGGIATPAWYDMIAKVIPVQRRGIWKGMAGSLGAGMGIIGAFFVGHILVGYDYPYNFAILFLAAYGCLIISWVMLALNREPPSNSTKQRLSTLQYIRQLPQVLRRNPNYSRYLISRSTIQVGTMASAFYMVYGIERFALDGAAIGILTGVLIGTQAVLNLVWGNLGDRLGHKTVLTSAAFLIALAPVVALGVPSFLGLAVVFVLVGAYVSADMVSALNIILEFSTPEDRPTYIGLTNTLLAPMVTIAPIFGGWLAEVAGYRGLFMAALIITTLGGLLMRFWVQEPRRAVNS